MPARRLAALSLALACLPALARGEEAPTDALLKLLPADAGAVLAADDLRGRWAAFVGSGLAGDFGTLPAFRASMESRSARDFFQARDQILGFLQTSHGEIRDEILGDAAVLAILPPEAPDGPLGRSRGLLTLKARKPELLKRLVDQVNIIQKQNGEIAAVVEARRGDVAYFTRRFPAGAEKPTEAYVLFPDGVFAFSDSEAAVLEVIDRRSGSAEGASFLEAPGYATASAALAGRPLARLYLSPEFLRRALDEQPGSSDPAGRPIAEAIRGHLDGLDRIAATLELNGEKVQVRLLQAFKADALRRPGGRIFALFRPVTDRPEGPGPRMLALPETAVAAASFRVDPPALYGAYLALLSEADRPRVAKLETIADALLLGRGLRSSILPALGPRAVAYLESPDAGPRQAGFPLPLVASVEIDEDGGEVPGKAATADALDNALRATLAALSLDEKRAPATARVVTRDGVTSLDVPYPFAFAIDGQRRRLTVGTSADAIARYLQAGARTDAGERFRAIRASGFPDCESFACVDVAAFVSLSGRYKEQLVAVAARRDGRPPEEVALDFDRFLAVASLFDAAFLAARFDAPSAVMEHRIGLLARPPAAP